MAKEVEDSAIDKAMKKLANLPEKTPPTRPIAAALELMKEKISTALARGYTRAEVVEILNSQGIAVKEYHIKNLFKKPREKTSTE
jgi:hypothetical protein